MNKFPQLEVVDQEFGKPNWVKIFENIDDLQEGEIVLLNGFVEPVGDPSLRIEWYFNNAPMQNCRFKFFVLNSCAARVRNMIFF